MNHSTFVSLATVIAVTGVVAGCDRTASKSAVAAQAAASAAASAADAAAAASSAAATAAKEGHTFDTEEKMKLTPGLDMHHQAFTATGQVGGGRPLSAGQIEAMHQVGAMHAHDEAPPAVKR